MPSTAVAAQSWCQLLIDVSAWNALQQSVVTISPCPSAFEIVYHSCVIFFLLCLNISLSLSFHLYADVTCLFLKMLSTFAPCLSGRWTGQRLWWWELKSGDTGSTLLMAPTASTGWKKSKLRWEGNPMKYILPALVMRREVKLSLLRGTAGHKKPTHWKLKAI